MLNRMAVLSSGQSKGGQVLAARCTRRQRSVKDGWMSTAIFEAAARIGVMFGPPRYDTTLTTRPHEHSQAHRAAAPRSTHQREATSSALGRLMQISKQKIARCCVHNAKFVGSSMDPLVDPPCPHERASGCSSRPKTLVVRCGPRGRPSRTPFSTRV